MNAKQKAVIIVAIVALIIVFTVWSLWFKFEPVYSALIGIPAMIINLDFSQLSATIWGLGASAVALGGALISTVKKYIKQGQAYTAEIKAHAQTKYDAETSRLSSNKIIQEIKGNNSTLTDLSKSQQELLNKKEEIAGNLSTTVETQEEKIKGLQATITNLQETNANTAKTAINTVKEAVDPLKLVPK